MAGSQTEILVILIAGNVFNQASYTDLTNIVLSIVLIGITVLFILFFIYQVRSLARSLVCMYCACLLCLHA